MTVRLPPAAIVPPLPLEEMRGVVQAGKVTVPVACERNLYNPVTVPPIVTVPLLSVKSVVKLIYSVAVEASVPAMLMSSITHNSADVSSTPNNETVPDTVNLLKVSSLR